MLLPLGADEAQTGVFLGDEHMRFMEHRRHLSLLVSAHSPWELGHMHRENRKLCGDTYCLS